MYNFETKKNKNSNLKNRKFYFHKKNYSFETIVIKQQPNKQKKIYHNTQQKKQIQCISTLKTYLKLCRIMAKPIPVKNAKIEHNK